MVGKHLTNTIIGDYIGEIRDGKDIGRSNLNQPYKWNPCPDCGTLKWSHICKGNVHHTLCKRCVYTRAHKNIIDKHTGKPRGDRPNTLPTTKFCYKCQRELPLTSFYKGHDSYTGRRSACIECGKKECRKWRETDAGRHSNREAAKRYHYTENGKTKKKEYIESGKRQQNLERLKKYYDNLEYKPLTKICTVCKRNLPLSSYGENIGGKYNLKSRCRKCMDVLELLYKHTDKGKAADKRYYESDGYKKMIKQYRSTYIKPEKTKLNNKRLKQTEKYKQKSREYAKSPQYKEHKKLYYQTELGKACIARCSHNRRIRNKAVPATLTAIEWNEIKKRYKYRCVYCGEKKPLTRDHIIPLSKNGPLTKENVIPACKSCNSIKYDKPVLLQILAMDKPKEPIYST
jgi:hypothetical protein